MNEEEVVEPATDTPAADRLDHSDGFAELGLGERLLKSLRQLGYERPTPIQAETIPALLAGRNLVGLAQTGTGKTAAFALPILSRLDLKQKAPQALVLAPTRELALQVAEAFEKYSAHLKGVRLLPVYGGQGYGVQLSALARGVHIVVGTPGRVMDHLEKGTLDLTQLRLLVLDEADEMLSMGFAEDVEQILADTPDDKQVALFSATMPAQIRALSQRYLTDPVEGLVRGSTSTAPAVSSSRASLTSWLPPTSPPVGWTSTGSATWSTSTSPPIPSRTCTGWDAPDAPAAAVRRSRSSPRGNATCCGPSSGPPGRP